VQAFRAVRALKPEHVIAAQVCCCCCTSATPAALLCAANCTRGCIMDVSCARLKSGAAGRCLPAPYHACSAPHQRAAFFPRHNQPACMMRLPARLCTLLAAHTCTVAREAQNRLRFAAPCHICVVLAAALHSTPPMLCCPPSSRRLYQRTSTLPPHPLPLRFK
jgi:hypothetical protein